MSVETKELTCIGCGKGLEPDTKFCPFCRAKQEPSEKTASAAATKTEAPPGSLAKSPAPPVIKFPPPADLTLRASENIWSHTESEGEVIPGAQRPFLVLDEQSVHLSHTDNHLAPEDLLKRIEAVIEAYSVPVEVKLSSTRWLRDSSEVRPRIVASLRDHQYSDYKMIFGVDYMGKWASIKMYLAFEPPVIPPPPPPPYEPAYPPEVKPEWPAGSIICFVVAGIAMLGGVINASQSSNMSILFMTVFSAAIFSIFAVSIRGNETTAKNKQRDEEISRNKSRFEREYEEYEEKIKEERRSREINSMVKSFFRTYKVDDMRLFSSAMKTVFQVVVDDIVQVEGAKIEKIEGGKGGFLNEDGVTSIAQTPRQEDAAENFDL